MKKNFIILIVFMLAVFFSSIYVYAENNSPRQKVEEGSLDNIFNIIKGN